MVSGATLSLCFIGRWRVQDRTRSSVSFVRVSNPNKIVAECRALDHEPRRSRETPALESKRRLYGPPILSLCRKATAAAGKWLESFVARDDLLHVVIIPPFLDVARR